MTKKILSFLLVGAICFVSFFSCRKVNVSTTDATRNYFPLQKGKTITYDVDSIYYADCLQREVKSQMLYSITDTFRDSKKRLTYIMDVFTRPYDGGIWQASTVIYITPTVTKDSLLYTQDQTQYIKLIFPVANGTSWLGNLYAEVQDPVFAYLSGWNYTYQDYNLSYNNGLANFSNTVTVLEDNQAVGSPSADSAESASYTYAKEVYAYNVGMIYKEWKHWTYEPDTTKCVTGYSVIMQAIDHN